MHPNSPFPVLAGHHFSLSISQGGQALRAATSAARVLCLAEAARRLNASPDVLSVVDGWVLVNGHPTELQLVTLATELDLGVPVVDHEAPVGQPVCATKSTRPDLRARMGRRRSMPRAR